MLEQGHDIPDTFADPPDIEPHLEFYVRAWNELCGDRGSTGLIPWTAIKRYADHHGVAPGFEFETFRFFVVGIDLWYVQREREKAKKEAERQKANSRIRGPRRGGRF